MDDLKPCPICGANFKFGQEPDDNYPVGGMIYIFHEYGPLGPKARRCPIDVNRHFHTKNEALEAWNTRVPNPTLNNDTTRGGENE